MRPTWLREGLLIERLTDKQQRILAVGLLFVVGLVAYLLVVEPLLALSSEYHESIEDLEFQLQRYKKVAAGKAILLERVKTIRAHQEASKNMSTRDTPALASADLQQFVKQAIVTSGGQLTSTQVVPARDDGHFLRIALKVRMSGTMDALRGVLYAIETARPILIVDNLNVRPVTGRRNRRTRKIEPSDQLNVNFEVEGYMNATPA